MKKKRAAGVDRSKTNTDGLGPIQYKNYPKIKRMNEKPIVCFGVWMKFEESVRCAVKRKIHDEERIERNET